MRKDISVRHFASFSFIILHFLRIATPPLYFSALDCHSFHFFAAMLASFAFITIRSSRQRRRFDFRHYFFSSIVIAYILLIADASHYFFPLSLPISALRLLPLCSVEAAITRFSFTFHFAISSHFSIFRLHSSILAFAALFQRQASPADYRPHSIDIFIAIICQ